MQEIMTGKFSSEMMEDWKNNDKNLLSWREATGNTEFEQTISSEKKIDNKEYFERGIAMIAFVKSGVELAFETMVNTGIIDESAYYESLHELPLIANLISRKKLYEMNRIISDTAEYGCYLFSNEAKKIYESEFEHFNLYLNGDAKDNPNETNEELVKKINFEIQNHPVEKIGLQLRKSMTEMKNLF